jgi:AraC-like DNA-binding protein
MPAAKSTASTRQRPEPTVWARAVRAFVDRAEHSGIPREALLRRARIVPADLAAPETRLALPVLYDLLEAIEDLAGDPLAPARLTRGFEFDALEALAFVVLTSATLGDGIRAMLKYQRLFAEGERYELDVSDARATLRYVPWGPTRRGHERMAEMFAVDIVVNAARLSGGPFDRARIRFAHEPPAPRVELARIFGDVEIAFGHSHCEIELPPQALARRLAPEGLHGVRHYLAAQLEERVRSLGAESIAGSVRDALLDARTMTVDIAALARRLRMSARTLQRRLREEGTTLRVLADEARKARAIPLIRQGHAIAEVSFLVGYKEASAFHRAFRRWTGTTPESFRAT